VPHYGKSEMETVYELFEALGCKTPFCTEYSNKAKALTAEDYEEAADLIRTQLERPIEWKVQPATILFPPDMPRSVVRKHLELDGIPFNEDDLAIFDENAIEEPQES